MYGQGSARGTQPEKQLVRRESWVRGLDVRLWSTKKGAFVWVGHLQLGLRISFSTSDNAKDQVEAAKYMLGKGLASQRGGQNG